MRSQRATERHENRTTRKQRMPSTSCTPLQKGTNIDNPVHPYRVRDRECLTERERKN